MKKVFFFNSLIILISILFSFIVIEFFLRINNNEIKEKFDEDNTKKINQFNEKIGWDLKPGKYLIKYNPKFENKFQISITDEKYRFSGNVNQNNDDIIILGGSVTLGFGVNDDETFSYLIQKKLSKFNIKNYAAGGYSTYQSFLKLEEILKKKNKIKFIFAIYNVDHEIRNIGNEEWLKILTKYSSKGYLYVPFASLDKNGELKRFKPIKYIRLPFSDKLLIINKIEKAFMRLFFYYKKSNQKLTTLKIFEEMHNLAKKNESELIIISLSGNVDNLYRKFFDENQIKNIICQIPYNDKYIIKGDAHPNKEGHNLFGDCILNELTFLM